MKKVIIFLSIITLTLVSNAQIYGIFPDGQSVREASLELTKKGFKLEKTDLENDILDFYIFKSTPSNIVMMSFTKNGRLESIGHAVILENLRDMLETYLYTCKLLEEKHGTFQVSKKLPEYVSRGTKSEIIHWFENLDGEIKTDWTLYYNDGTSYKLSLFNGGSKSVIYQYHKNY